MRTNWNFGAVSRRPKGSEFSGRCVHDVFSSARPDGLHGYLVGKQRLLCCPDIWVKTRLKKWVQLRLKPVFYIQGNSVRKWILRQTDGFPRVLLFLFAFFFSAKIFMCLCLTF